MKIITDMNGSKISFGGTGLLVVALSIFIFWRWLHTVSEGRPCQMRLAQGYVHMYV